MSNYSLPPLIENQYIPMLAKLYEIRKNTNLQKILVNAEISIEEGVRYDNWNGGQNFHNVVLKIPEKLFFEIYDKKDVYAKTLASEINKLINSTNEHIDDFIIDTMISKDDNWKEKSGLLLNKSHDVSQVTQDRIWEKNKYRLFFSHKTVDKENVASLKKALSDYGISCFVAHEDIKVTQAWAEEIENALFSADALVAIMTETFHDSEWTDHEIGVAYGRGIEFLAVKKGRNPYGIIGRFQALTAEWGPLPMELMKYFLQFYKVRESFVIAIETCSCFEVANKYAKLFPYIKIMEIELCKRIEKAYKENSYVERSFGFKGSKIWNCNYGYGISHYLDKWQDTHKNPV